MQNSSSHHSLSSLSTTTQRSGGKALPPMSKFYYGPAQARTSSSGGGKQTATFAAGQMFTIIFSYICVAYQQRVRNVAIPSIGAVPQSLFLPVAEIINAMAITWSSTFSPATQSSHFCFIQSHLIWPHAWSTPVTGQSWLLPRWRTSKYVRHLKRGHEL